MGLRPVPPDMGEQVSEVRQSIVSDRFESATLGHVRPCAACGEDAYLNHTDEGDFYICAQWHRSRPPAVSDG